MRLIGQTDVGGNIKQIAMKNIITIILMLISANVFSQSTEIEEIEELQEALRSYKSGEKHYGAKHDKAYRLLSIDKYNNTAIFYLLSSYREIGQKDSIQLFFNNLIKNNPNDIEPYLIRERYENYENLSRTDRINNLKKALEIDPKDEQINYSVGKLYYELFVREYNKNKKKENLDYYATNSIKYFTVVCEQEEAYKEILKFPLLQLANYLGDLNKKKLYENYNTQILYFPVSVFVNLPNDWETNYSVNVIDFASSSNFSYSGIESAIFSINWYSRHLLALEEPALSDSSTTKIYRFTYLRTFDNPVVIGLVNSNDTITIYWKVADGTSGYEPGNISESKTKQLTINDWNNFENKINAIKFWSLPSIEKGLLGSDGSQWILEGKAFGKYHLVDRWCGEKITSVCKDLIELTGMEIKEIY